MNFRSENKSQTLIGLALVLIGVALRVLPHPDNFAPVSAIALFGGVVLSPALSLTVPLVAMIAGDMIVGPHSLYWATWGSFFIVSLIGVWVRRKPGILPVALATVGSSVLFFILTNLAVFFEGKLYPVTREGFWQCYIMALPFFQNTFLSDVFYCGVFFSLFALAKRSVPSLSVSR